LPLVHSAKSAQSDVLVHGAPIGPPSKSGLHVPHVVEPVSQCPLIHCSSPKHGWPLAMTPGELQSVRLDSSNDFEQSEAAYAFAHAVACACEMTVPGIWSAAAQIGIERLLHASTVPYSIVIVSGEQRCCRSHDALRSVVQIAVACAAVSPGG